jgi:hypothetical protein
VTRYPDVAIAGGPGALLKETARGEESSYRERECSSIEPTGSSSSSSSWAVEKYTSLQPKKKK